jgi:hypothetical protein
MTDLRPPPNMMITMMIRILLRRTLEPVYLEALMEIMIYIKFLLAVGSQ